jgi:hypothetical protein
VSHCSTVETTGVRPIARWSWTFRDGGWGCYNFCLWILIHFD